MSVLFFIVVIIWLAEKIVRRKIFSPCEWTAVWIFGVAASLILYPSALGLTRIDTYTWGWTSWSSKGLISMIALITVGLLWRKNKFGIALLLTLCSFAFHVRASTNLWDYVIDPSYGAISIVICLRKVIRLPRRSGGC